MLRSGSSTWRILLAPLQQRRNQRTLWFLLLVAALALVGPAAIVALASRLTAGARSPGWDVYGTMLWGGFATLAVGGWAVIASSVFEQNLSTAARLVPGHVRGLRRTLLATWGALVAAVSTGFVLQFHHALATLALVAGILAMVAVAMRWPLTWIVASLGTVSFATMSRAPWAVDSSATWLAVWRAAPLPITGGVLLLSLATLRGLVQEGGTRHARSDETRRARATRLRLRSSGLEPTTSADCAMGGLGARLRTAPYLWCLRRALAHPRRSTMTRVMLAFGPSTHWTGYLANIAIVLSWIVFAVLVFSSLWHAGVGTGVLGGFAVSAIFPFAAPALQARARLYQTRREQALLALLPGVPRGAALNRALSWRLSGQFALTWLIGVGLVAIGSGWLLPHPIGRPQAGFGDAPLLVAASLLPLLPALWRRWSSLPAPTPMSANLLFVVPIALAVGAWLMERQAGWPFGAIAAVYAAVPLGWCALRWRAMGREPSAFPVSRLAR